MPKLLEINHLRVAAENREILKDVNLTIKTGEIHLLVGKNGAGKSSLAGTLAGEKKFLPLVGSAKFLGLDLLGLSMPERAARGLFVAFQSVPSLPGVTIMELVRAALAARNDARNLSDLYHDMNNFLDLLGLPRDVLDRDLTGFSGGEKRKLELFQMLMLKPRLAILDEVDSGLDQTSIKALPDWLKKYHDTNNSLLIVTHREALKAAFPDATVHELENGVLA